MIGYATIDRKALKAWAKSQKKIKEDTGERFVAPLWDYENRDYFYSHSSEFKNCRHIFERGSFGDYKDRTEELISLLDRLDAEGQKLHVWYADDTAVAAGYSSHKYIVPAKLIEVKLLADYDDLTAGDMHHIGVNNAMGDMLPADMSDKSMTGLKGELEERKAEIEAAEKECKAKVEKLREELRKKEQELLEQLEKETAGLIAMKEELEKKIMVLDTKIYSIRCFLGEVVDFTQIRDGRHADKTEPVVLFQKIRYLDEEIGKYFSIHDMTDNGTGQFLSILKNRDDIRDLFCPSERSISMIRISRTGTIKGASDKVSNMLEDYEYMHARQMAVLVRDGESLYIGWTDEDRIGLSTEDFFMKPGQTISSTNDEDTPKKSSSTDMISRYYLFSILQGIADRGDMICFPDKVNMAQESEYVKFSYAEGWLKDNRFGTFEDMLEKDRDIPIKKGDTILTAMNISRDDHRAYGGRYTEYDAWNNDRGIGDKNRTHGAHIPGFEIMKINKVLKSAEVEVTVDLYRAEPRIVPDYVFRYDNAKVYRLVKKDPPEKIGTVKTEIRFSHDDYNKTGKTNPSWLAVACANINGALWNKDDPSSRYSADMHRRIDDMPDLDIYGVAEVTACRVKEGSEDVKAYVSVEKGVPAYGENITRCNFEILPDEYIRTDFLCSTWLEYVIYTGNIGKLSLCGSQMSYADLIKYLNKLLEHARRREAEEEEKLRGAQLGEWVSETPEWNRIVTEWRMKHGIRKIDLRNVYMFRKYITGLDNSIDIQKGEGTCQTSDTR